MTYNAISEANKILLSIPGGEPLRNEWHNNPSDTAPYHNKWHNAIVAYETYKLANSVGMRNETRKQELFIAGLFHDYGHSAGTAPDHQNITQAIEKIYLMEALLEASGYNPDSIAHYIAGTEHPLPEYYTLNTGHRILRDADLIQWVHPNYTPFREQYMEGLSVEKGAPVTFDGTKEFLRTVDWYTKEAEEFYMQSDFNN